MNTPAADGPYREDMKNSIDHHEDYARWRRSNILVCDTNRQGVRGIEFCDAPPIIVLIDLQGDMTNAYGWCLAHSQLPYVHMRESEEYSTRWDHHAILIHESAPDFLRDAAKYYKHFLGWFEDPPVVIAMAADEPWLRPGTHFAATTHPMADPAYQSWLRRRDEDHICGYEELDESTLLYCQKESEPQLEGRCRDHADQAGLPALVGVEGGQL